MPLTASTLAQNPVLQVQLPALHRQAWPRFLLEDAVSKRYWNRLYADFAGYQLLLHDETNTVAAAAHAVPIVWDGTVEGLPAGSDAVLTEAMQSEQPAPPNTLCALAAVVAPFFRGRGLSYRLIEEVKQLAPRLGLSDLIIPVRPTHKSRYPLTPMENYIRWTGEGGLPFDPWLRVHARAGAEFLVVAPRSRVVRGTVEAWEAWSGMRFPESGRYIVAGALQPIEIDQERDSGLYEEPNFWVRHPNDER